MATANTNRAGNTTQSMNGGKYMRILTLNETGMVAGGMMAIGGYGGGGGYSGGGYFSSGGNGFDWSAFGGGSGAGIMNMDGLGNEAGTSVSFNISDPANFYSPNNVITLTSVTVNGTTNSVFGDHLNVCDYTAGSIGGATGGRIGSILGGVAGFLLGSVGELLGPEVGVPTTVALTRWGSLGGASIGAYFGARYATNGAHLCIQ